MWRATAIAALLAGCGRYGFFEPPPGGDACAVDPTIWQRNHDWLDGTSVGTSTGNPIISAGQPVWFYELTQGGPLGASDAWYWQPAALLVWDNSWYGDAGAWVRSDDLLPQIAPNDMVHGQLDVDWPYMPRARWRNPLDTELELYVQGRFRIGWHGMVSALVTDIDVVVGHLAADGRPLPDVFARTVAKPTQDTTTEELAVQVPETMIHVAAGESLVISVRSRLSDTTASQWVSLYDDLILLALGCR